MKKTAQDYIFVGLQLMLFAGYVFEWLPRVKVPAAVTVSGMALAVLGLAIAVFSVINLNRSLTVFPTPKKGAELIESGLIPMGTTPDLYGHHPCGVWICSRYRVCTQTHHCLRSAASFLSEINLRGKAAPEAIPYLCGLPQADRKILSEVI